MTPIVYAVALAHIMGNPMLATSEPRFASLAECRAHVERLNAGPARLWEYVCWGQR